MAQCGYSFNSASVLSLVPQPPVPKLNLGAESQQMSNPVHNTGTQYTTSTFPTLPISGNQNLAAQSSAPFSYEQSFVDQLSGTATVPSISSVVQSDFDDFTDFQSASCPASSALFSPEHKEIANLPKVVESKELQGECYVEPITSPSNSTKSSSHSSSLIEKLASPPHDSKLTTVQKFPTVAVIGGGRSIGSRLANHSLTTPKPTKTRHHKHHHHHHRSVPPQPAAVSVDEEFSDFQQASSEDVSKTLSKPPASHTYLLKESAIRVNDSVPIPKIPEPASIAKPTVSLIKDHQTGSRPTALPVVQPPATKVDNTEDADVLMGVEEDRYSALRALSAFSESPAEQEDEYGDFFSATAPTNDDSFADIAARDNAAVVEQVLPQWGATETAAPTTSEFEVDDWGTFMSTRDLVQPSNHPQMEENTTMPSQTIACDNAYFESSNDWKTEPSTIDTLSTQVRDLNLSSLNYSASLETENLTLTPPVSSKAKEQDNILSLFDQVSHPVMSVSNVDNVNTSQNIEDNDDFGDFVSPVSFSEKGPVLEKDRLGTFWADEGKESDSQSVGKLWLDDSKSVENQPWSDEGGKYDHVKLSKDGMLDNPLVSNLWLEEGKGVDNQSVRSLELPGLDQAWDSVGEWRRCVQSCVSVLQFAVDTFESVSEPKVLLEVLTSCEGQDYLKGLVEVWAVCERLASSYRQSGTDHKLDALLNSAESMWVSLKPHYLQAQLPVESDETTEGGEPCGICLVGGAKLEFGGHTYHAACANLWLNLVDTGLPALHQPCL